MAEDISVLLGVPRPPPPPPVPGTSTARDLPAALVRRYSDAYTEAHAVIAAGRLVKSTATALFIVILIASFGMASESHMSGTIATLGLALACLIGIPTYILGIMVAAQGQTALATLDAAVNSSRHLSDDDVAHVLSKRFSL